MAAVSHISAATQTVLTFPPLHIVESCPMPSTFDAPQKVQNIPDNYANAMNAVEMTDVAFNQTDVFSSNETNLVTDIGSSEALGLKGLKLLETKVFGGHSNHAIESLKSDISIKNAHVNSSEEAADSEVSSSIHSPKTHLDAKPNQALGNQQQKCAVCGDGVSVGFYRGAYVCEACKKFYHRMSKKPGSRYICSRACRDGQSGACVIDRHLRTNCVYCRYQKCLSVGMELPGKGLLETHSVKSLGCKVCGAPSSGFNFGVLTCEGCKGFFRRQMQDGGIKVNNLVCCSGWNCSTDFTERPQCRACRYAKCVRVGMSKDAVRVGRLSNSVRYARILKHKIGSAEEHPGNSKTDLKLKLDEPFELESPDLMDFDDSEQTSAHSATKGLKAITSHLLPRVPSHELTGSTFPHPMGANKLYISTNASQQYCKLERSMDVSHLHPCTDLKKSIDVSRQYCEPLDLSSNIQSACSIQRRVKRLADLFERTRKEYYMTITDKEMLDPGMTNKRLAELIFEQFQQCSRLFVGFYRKVDGFMQLNLEDRVLLTKCSIYRTLLLAASQRYDLVTGRYYMFAWKSWERVPSRLIAMYPEYKILVYHFENFGRQIKQADCTAEELALISVLITINKDNLTMIKDSEAVSRIHNDYTQLLKSYTKANYKDPTKRMAELEHILDLCRQAAKDHAAAAKTVINKYPVEAQNAEIIPQLYKEMFSNTPWTYKEGSDQSNR